MAARGPVPDASLAPSARRRLPHRGAVLAAATLCVLALLAGAVAHSAGVVQHRHPALAATVVAANDQGTHARGTLDLAAPAGATADPARAVFSDTAVAVSRPASTSVDAERTRGPPAIAG